MIFYIFYIILLIFTSLYSYVLVDPNITFLNHPLWTTFRDFVVQIGYYNRPLSFGIYLTLIILLFIAHFYIVKNFKNYKPLKVALIVGGVALFAYPFLSHDFFNYMFDAKIFTFYGENPYLKKALDFPDDPWIRFMHWTHRTYPYGPVFLVLSVVPSFLAMGKFLLHFLFLKAIYVAFYAAIIFYLQKFDKKKALEFATHPFIIIEGLVNAHNDFIALALGIIGLFYLTQSKINKKNVIGIFFLILSAGIKYMTAPYLLLIKQKNNFFQIASFVLTLVLIIYLALTKEIQQWYFLNLLIFGIIWKDFIAKWGLFLFGVLLSYYPFIYHGGWSKDSHLYMKYWIMIFFFLLNAGYVGYLRFKK